MTFQSENMTIYNLRMSHPYVRNMTTLCKNVQSLCKNVTSICRNVAYNVSAYEYDNYII